MVSAGFTVKELHKEFLLAGSDVLQSFTYNSTENRLQFRGCEYTVSIPMLYINYFFKTFLSDILTCPILGPLVPLFWISGDVSFGFQSQSGFCLIHTTKTWYTKHP